MADEEKNLVTNRSALHEYHIHDRYEAGIALQGTEVKSIRAGQIQLKESYVSVRDGEAWLFNAHISPYSHGNRLNHDPVRTRKLLLHRREIDRLIGKTRERGLTIVPTRLYFRGPHAKVEIALARGKDRGDKRHAIKEREMKREMERAIRRR